jgi:uncharacterized protein YciI
MVNPRRMAWAWVCGAVVLAAVGGGCAGGGGRAGQPGAGEARFVYVTLKSGPTSGQGAAADRQAMFRGHMANMQRLADEGKLIIGGPFAKPRDKAWRGVFVFDVASVDEAAALSASDPGFVAGEFVGAYEPMVAREELRQTLALERARKDAKARATGEPPADVRGFVMVTAEDLERARRALRGSSLKGQTVWWGRFVGSDGRGRGGVIVLDATDAAAVSATLAELDTGPVGVDGWWSTAALLGLPAGVRE